jgi:4-hydroxybenzoate polyprenyltransferase
MSKRPTESPITTSAGPRGRAPIFARLEQAGSGGWRWLALLAVWILARNLLEGILEQPHVLGFDWRFEISAPMVFLHFPLFYLGIFLGAALWLHIVTRRPLSAVAGVVACGFGLLLAAPVVDAIATGGRGWDLGYLSGFGPAVARFWDPTAALAEVSPGQRVEIALACVLAALYAGAAGTGRAGRARAWACGGLAAAGLFLWAAFLGAWPAWFARLGAGAAGGIGGQGVAYAEVFRGFGLVPDESRRYAAALALPVLPLVLVFCGRLDPPRWRGFLATLSWPRLAHYTGLVPAGAFLGWWLYKSHLPGAFHNPTDWAALALLWAAMVAAYGAALLWNDVHDRAGDSLDDPRRPLVTGLLDARRAQAFAWGCAALAAWLALIAGYHPFLLVLACLVLAHLYSAPPVRLKRWPLAATLTLGLLSLLSMWTGFSLFAQEMTPVVFPRRIAALVLLGVTLGFTAKDLKDARGDAATGVHTIATWLGDARARRVAAALVLAAYLFAPLLLPLGLGYWVVAALFGAASAVATLQLRRPDDLLLVGFLVFAAATGLFLAAVPPAQVSTSPLAADRAARHGILRWVEEAVRLQRRAREGLLPAGVIVPDPAALDRGIVDCAGGRDASLEPRLDCAGGRDALLEPRLLWARAQLAGGPAAGEALQRLAGIEPLNAAWWEQGVVEAEASVGPLEALAVCTAALARGVRPGDFLRHRAAAALAAARAREGEDGAAAGGRDGGAGSGSPGGRAAVLLAEARRDLAGAFVFGQELPALWVLAGDLALRQSGPQVAAERYRRAIDLDARRAEAWAGLGEALFTATDLEAAVAAFERAAALSPSDPWLLNNLGVALREARRYEQAAEVLQRAALLGPQLFEPVYNLGLTCEARGDLAGASLWLARARSLRPGFGPVEEALRRIEQPIHGGPHP